MVRKDGPRRQRDAAPIVVTTTLGAHVPGAATFSTPDISTFYWTPCVHRFKELTPAGWRPVEWVPHCYFINDSQHPHAACPAHRKEAASSSAPVPGVLAAGTPSAVAPSGATFADPQEPAPPDNPKTSVADFARVPPGGKPPWAADADGKPLWERVGGAAGISLREWYEERAAILEYLGNITRAHAEHNAYEMLIRAQGHHALSRQATR